MDNSESPRGEGYLRLHHLEQSVFPPSRPSAVYGGAVFDPELDVAVPSGPPGEDDLWREVGDHVWTGECFVYAPRRPQEEYVWEVPRQPGDYDPENLEFPESLPYTSPVPFDWVPVSSTEPVDARAPISPQPPVSPEPAAVASPAASEDEDDSESESESASASESPAVAPKKRKAMQTRSKSTKRARKQSSTNSASASASVPLRLTSTPPHKIASFDNANLLRLWHWKIVKKKGFGLMLKHFPGHSEESLRKVWVDNSALCRQLGKEWQQAGSPTA